MVRAGRVSVCVFSAGRMRTRGKIAKRQQDRLFSYHGWDQQPLKERYTQAETGEPFNVAAVEVIWHTA